MSRPLPSLRALATLVGLFSLAAAHCGDGDGKTTNALADTPGAGGAAGAGLGGSAGKAGGAGKAGAAGLAGASGASGQAGAAGVGPGDCDNSLQDGDETGVDCGGSCRDTKKCAVGKGCKEHDDCDVLNCVKGKCALPSCNDEVKNGKETDVDCGGDCPSKCGITKGCIKDADCIFNSCDLGGAGAGGASSSSGKCVEATCDDGSKNGSETDVDCGGDCPTKCGESKSCKGNEDCAEGNCLASVGNLCRKPTCDDNVKNGAESDKDCGGLCPKKCPPGNSCASAEDCTSQVCTNGKCDNPTCTDGVANGDEGDIDCGGSCPIKCSEGKSCTKATDCSTGSCSGDNKCAPPDCADGVKNGLETDLDCGGPACKLCKTGQVCKAPSDCDTGTCVNGKCALPSCFDGFANGKETDLDCGGDCIAKCGLGKKCVASADCIDNSCSNGVCVAPTCGDGVKNGKETDTDCGGGECASCNAGQVCKNAVDCSSQVCTQSKCSVPTCVDTIKNGTETDTDCGGPDCAPCADGKACKGSSDCKNKVCQSGACLAASCSDGVKNGNETDIDCGGNICPKCKVNQGCTLNVDCVSDRCDLTSDLCVCPTGMVIVPRSDGGTYCMDATEVTAFQYNAFWSSKQPATSTQHPKCGVNGGTLVNAVYTPEIGWPPQPGTENFPVVGVDWCDAYAYCANSNKHLCGAHGGGSVTAANATKPLAAEWYNACSAQGVNAYPHGQLYEPVWCNVSGALASVPYKSKVGIVEALRCQGGSPGLYDMSGSVAEWIDSCEANGECLAMGGHYSSDALGSTCSAALPLPLLSHLPTVGFRCCQ